VTGGGEIGGGLGVILRVVFGCVLGSARAPETPAAALK
jgi:hypothetical protein